MCLKPLIFAGLLLSCTMASAQTTQNPETHLSRIRKELLSSSEADAKEKPEIKNLSSLDESTTKGLIAYFRSLSKTEFRNAGILQRDLYQLGKSLTILDSVSLYQLNLAVKAEVAVFQNTNHAARLNTLNNRIERLLKFRNVLTPEKAVLMAAESLKTGSDRDSEDRLNMCYVKHRFLLAAVMEISDDDFKNSEKIAERKTVIRSEIKKSPGTVKYCYNHVIKFAASQGDKDSYNYIVARTREIRESIYGSTGSTVGSAASSGSAK